MKARPSVSTTPFSDLLYNVIDNRGKTCPTSETGIPLIATNCVKNSSLYPSHEKVRYISHETYKNWFRGHPKPGDLIFVTKGAPGQVCIAPDPVNFCIAQDMVALQVDEKKVYPKFLFALLRADQTQTAINNMHVGTMIPHFKKGDFDKLLLPIPDKTVQIFAGDIYYLLSKKIELNRKMNATLEAMARALFKSWFVDFDPVRAKSEGREPFGMDADTAALFPSRLVPSALGDIPEGWEERRMEKIVDTISKTYPLHTVSKVVFLNTGDIQNGRFLHTNKSDVESLPGQAKKSIQKGDILYSEIRPENKRFAFVHFDCHEYVVSTKLMVLRAKTQTQALFAYFVLSDQANVDFLQMMAESRSGTFPQITYSVLSRIAFVAPNDNELIELFAKRHLESVHEKMLSNDKETLRLEKLRDYLLPKLISGEIRIPDVEELVEAI